ncbi:YhgE/Pip domain-containing protein [Streptomyces sioyaensis]|uniref:YhgE/Pip domain-containing protein n=1 Tax=Streptomyces sioyaensis TaxID=67364 RepID=A0A4Q1RAC1_9ACTN|nr:YhgE/Pip domain-containing protein [Streptomyces sioyaensis]MBM4791363.1 YhgE/Pip domain-containing protein [Streptomyces sioyaensis]RXS70393.1 YhgE/Pip domain-containing protein [Streptomyces sioyaensis]
MRSPRLAALELRRFSRGKLPRLGLVALTLIPLLYGALYLCSFWDPYSRLDKIPVALVNDDRGATADGKKITAGDDLADKVKDSKTFHWEEVSAADAAKGVENGTYYLSLTVPQDFSKRIASSSGDDPQTGALKVRTNDANNYVVGSISKSVFSEIRAKTSASSSRAMLDKIFVSFSDLHDQTAKAADGAGKVDKGVGSAKKGSGDLADGLGKLNEGAGKVSQGAGDLSRGASSAVAKARELSAGAGQVADGTQQLADKVHGIAKKDLPYLREHGKEIGAGAQFVADATETLDDVLDTLPSDSAKAATQARKNADNAAEIYQDRCGGLLDTDPDCTKLKALADGSKVAADAAEKVHDAVAGADFGPLRSKLHEVHQGAVMVAEQAPGIGQRADTAIRQINALNAGAHKVSQGAGLFADGIGTLADGAGKVADGAGKVHSGVGTAKSGAVKLTGGLFKLKDGTNQLADGLHSGVAKIPDYNKKDRDARTEVMADPVELAAKSMHKAPNYGTGLAPYFIPLSLWVGAMVAFMLLPALGKRALAAGAPGWRITLGSWLPAYAVGVVQVLALMAVLHWGLGLQMARSAGTVGFLLLATACFTAIIQLLGAFFGPAGRVLTLIVLMLQLTSAGGTYPVQTSPGFFAAIHPFLPMSYVVDGLRRLITGGDLGIVWQGCGVLVAFTLGALALTALAARSRQVVRMKDLHPELSL